ncbi:MAG: hypothetical protein M0Z80_14770 [Treponema sp.]|nr:hypothetical protein [Treponema sp.]
MRTTLDVKDRLMRSIYAKAGEEHRPIKDVVNETLEAGLDRFSGKRDLWECPTHELGGGRFDYTKAWELVDGMEADAVAEKLELRK